MYINAKKEEVISFLDSERERFNRVIEENRFFFQKEEVLRASQRMDQVILYWYRKKQIRRRIPEK